jgi:predicted O-linked N-acetylglucosamine transferase (SPINDLY family)
MQTITNQIYALIQRHEYGEAEVLFTRNYRSSDFEWNRLGGFLAGLQEHHADAYSYFQKAASLKSQDANIFFNCANSAFQCGDLAGALTHVGRALKLESRYASAWFLQGRIQHHQGSLSAALDSYRAALSIQPDYLDARINLIQTFLQLELYAEASKLAGQLLRLARQQQVAIPEVWLEMAKIFMLMKDTDVAGYCLDIVITLDPAREEALRLKGIVLTIAGYDAAAMPFLQHALEFDANNLTTRATLSYCFSTMKDYQKAIQTVEREVLDDQFCDFLLGAYCEAKLAIMDWKDLDDVICKVVSRIKNDELAASPFQFLMLKDAPDLQLQLARRMVAFSHTMVAAPYVSQLRPSIDRQKIKLGYISPDFGPHPVSYLTAGLFAAHDRQRFEVYAISLKAHAEDSVYRYRIANTCDVFVRAEEGSLEEKIEQIRALNLDIAIDLCGHTTGSQVNLFTNRVAPIQINYIGYPGSMGGATDYILADKFVIPPSMQNHYSERIIRLPDSFQAVDDQRAYPRRALTREEAGLPPSGFVFCCHNNTFKVNQQMVDLWIEILEKTTQVRSVLWVVAVMQAQENLLSYIRQKNKALVDRVIFAPRVDSETYLARMMCADLFLDTLPFNAGATCSDALWMGLPVLTRTGQSFAGRMATSLLNALDMPELVCESEDEYVSKAVQLALTPCALQEIKEKLDGKRKNGRLFDTQRFTRNLERAYEVIYNKHLKGQVPEGFDLS